MMTAKPVGESHSASPSVTGAVRTSWPSKYTFIVLVMSSTTARRCGPTLKDTFASELPIILLPKSTPKSFRSTVTWVLAAQKASGRIRTRRSEYQRHATGWPEETVTATAFSIASLLSTGSLKTISIGCPEPTVVPFSG